VWGNALSASAIATPVADLFARVPSFGPIWRLLPHANAWLATPAASV
jgi:hypothetical protein